MKIIGIDPGDHWGWAFSDSPEIEKKETGTKKFRSLCGIYEDFVEILYTLQPDAVVLCRPFGAREQVIRKQSAQAAIFEFVCEKREIPYFELADSTLRKAVFGDGRKKKHDIHSIFRTKTDHESDACTAAVYGCMVLSEKNELQKMLRQRLLNADNPPRLFS